MAPVPPLPPSAPPAASYAPPAPPAPPAPADGAPADGAPATLPGASTDAALLDAAVDGAVDGADRCPSCGTPRPARYCGACGEARVDPRDLSLSGFVLHAVETFTSVDGTLWRTVVTLLRRPGRLTADWLAGRRRGYVKPLQLYVLANVALFLFLGGTFGGTALFDYRVEQFLDTRGVIGTYFFADHEALGARIVAQARAARLPLPEYVARLNATMHAQRSLWLVFGPVLAVVLAALYTDRRRPFGQHLVFAVHFFAFFLVFLALFFAGLQAFGYGVTALAQAWQGVFDAPMPGLGAVRWLFAREDRTGWIALAVIAAWLYRALGRVYPEAAWRVALRTLVLVGLLPFTFNLYRDLLLAITLWTT